MFVLIECTRAYFMITYNIAVLGGGGREHALSWKISQSQLCNKLICIPGNPGTAQVASNFDASIMDFDKVASILHEQQINLCIIGPDDPLAAGIVNFLQQHISTRNIMVVGPDQYAAQLESSKSFAKKFMNKYHIPTAAYAEFTTADRRQAIDYIMQHSLPIVLKADGLALGKGVVICQSHQEAIEELKDMLDGKFGKSSERVVIEEYLTGIECSVFIITDGVDYVLLPEAKDYKRIGEQDTGKNTGGMGAVSPVHFCNADFMQLVKETIIKPTIDGLQSEQIAYKGFIFFGLINVNGKPFVIEYNARLGDPETEVIMPRIESDIVTLLVACAQKKLKDQRCVISDLSAATVITVSKGYPDVYTKEKEIHIPESCKSLCFHMGTKLYENTLVTNGGRVLAITNLGSSLREALTLSYIDAENVQYETKYYRNDIGADLLLMMEKK